MCNIILTKDTKEYLMIFGKTMEHCIGFSCIATKYVNGFNKVRHCLNINVNNLLLL